jgi:hypothetical protein
MTAISEFETLEGADNREHLIYLARSEVFGMRKWSLAVALAIVLGGCAHLQPGSSASGSSGEPSDEELLQDYPANVAERLIDLRSKHEAALAAPANLPAVTAYADALLEALKDSYQQINAFDWTAYSSDAARLLGSAAPRGTPEEGANALAKRAMFQDVLSDEAGAIASRKQSFERAHTYLSGLGMIGVHRTRREAAEARTLCEKTRPLAKSEDELYDLFRECLQAAPDGETLEDRLPWANAEDLAFYKQRQDAEVEARLRQREADAEASRELQADRDHSESSTSESSSAPSGPKRASFTLHNACSKTVKLFYGETPEYGGGRTSSIGGNSRQSESMNEGEAIWILDDRGNGVSSFSASASVRSLEIASNCVSFRAR